MALRRIQTNIIKNRMTNLSSTVCSFLHTEPNKRGISHFDQDVVDTIDVNEVDSPPLHVLQDPLVPQRSVKTPVSIWNANTQKCLFFLNGHKQIRLVFLVTDIVAINHLWTNQEPWKASLCSPGWSSHCSPSLAAFPAGRRWRCSCLSRSTYAVRRSPWWIPSSCHWSWCTWRQHRKKNPSAIQFTLRDSLEQMETSEFLSINWIKI